jgi:hypothetical protein
MIDQFVAFFTRCHPGTPLDGPTAHDEWQVWVDGYLAGCEFALDARTTRLGDGSGGAAEGNRIDDAIAAAGDAVTRKGIA